MLNAIALSNYRSLRELIIPLGTSPPSWQRFCLQWGGTLRYLLTGHPDLPLALSRLIHGASAQSRILAVSHLQLSIEALEAVDRAGIVYVESDSAKGCYRAKERSNAVLGGGLDRPQRGLLRFQLEVARLEG